MAETMVATDRAACWAEPGTQHTYPLSFEAYRRAREAEEKFAPRHRTIGPAVDRYVWDHWRVASRSMPEVEVLLTMRADAPPRVRRMVVEILRAIRRGQPAGEAIRHVSRRFGLRRQRAQACLAACLGVQRRPLHSDTAPSTVRTPLALRPSCRLDVSTAGILPVATIPSGPRETRRGDT